MEVTRRKRELRRLVRTRLEELPMETILEKSRALEGRLFDTPWWRDAESLFCFVSMPREVQTIGIRRRAHAEGKAVALPRVDGDQIRFHRVDDPDVPLVRSAFGIDEPDAGLPSADPVPVDATAAALARRRTLVLVPGLAFDTGGYRLGRGRGFYDRFLGARRGDLFALGVCFEEQLVDAVPHDERDVPMEAILTDTRAI
jgi:5-formyltetrahydrofolate cyclo-ligase